MTPEQEAQLRARLAAARSEVIDLDDPQPDITASPTVIDLDDEPQPGFFQRAYDGLYNHDFGQPQGEFHKPDLDLTQEQIDRGRSATLAASPIMGGAWLMGHGAAGLMQDEFQRRQKQAESQAQEEGLTAQEQNYKKALENAKKMAAAKAAQEKAEKDRDEAAAEGRHGYRVERALYPSDLHRK